MKHINKICTLISILIGTGATGYSQTPDSLGLPGDNLNLYGVISLFKESKNVEEFEQKLNTPENKVNNLDLNNDGKIDYIRVKDYGKGDVHSLVLQTPVSEKESQDLAVVEVEKKGDNAAHVQVVGDEDLYGKDYIIEPQDEQQAQQTDNSNNNNNSSNYAQGPNVSVNVWGWPGIQYMYGPSYVYWNSPWYWGSYPRWWSPWRPLGYRTYWGGMYGYRAYHRRVYVNRIVVSRNIYYGHRQSSSIVHKNITNKVYYGPRNKTIINNNKTVNNTKIVNNNNKIVNNNNKTVGGTKQQNNTTTINNNVQKQNNQPKQQSSINNQQQNAPSQQVMQKKQIKQQPVSHGQQSMPKQQGGMQRQSAPHNGGGGHGGGGGHMGGGRGGGRR